MLCVYGLRRWQEPLRPFAAFPAGKVNENHVIEQVATNQNLSRRAAARRTVTAPTLSRVIKVGPRWGEEKIGAHDRTQRSLFSSTMYPTLGRKSTYLG